MRFKEGGSTHAQTHEWTLTTLRFPLVSRSASRNSPARLGSMLSCRRRASLPAPGRHRGRIPEWHTETRTDINTVLQHGASAGPPHAAGWDEAGTGAGGAQPPELSAMSRTPEAGVRTAEAPRRVLLLPAASVGFIRSSGAGGERVSSRAGCGCLRDPRILPYLPDPSGPKQNRKYGGTSFIYVRGETLPVKHPDI